MGTGRVFLEHVEGLLRQFLDGSLGRRDISSRFAVVTETLAVVALRCVLTRLF